MKLWSVYIMAILYILAGANHFLNKGMYMSIMPSWLPKPELLVFISGVCEILFGLLLIPTTTRPVAAWLIIALLIAVFPANIQMAINYYRQHNPYFWLTIVRLPLQAVLVGWAYSWTRT
jgi:uncharacterized membrane protein